jgi:hypothetical protein
MQTGYRNERTHYIHKPIAAKAAIAKTTTKGVLNEYIPPHDQNPEPSEHPNAFPCSAAKEPSGMGLLTKYYAQRVVAPETR